MQYWHTFHYVNTLKKQLQSSLGTFSCSSWQILSLLPKPFMKATLTLSNTQLPKCDRWPKSLNPAKPQQNTLNSIHPVCKVLLKSMSYDITIPVYHPRRQKAVKKPNPSTGTKLQQPQQHKQVNQHQPLPYAKNPNQCTRCGDSPHAQGFNCPAKKYQCKHCTKIGHFTKMCFTKSAHP